MGGAECSAWGEAPSKTDCTDPPLATLLSLAVPEPQPEGSRGQLGTGPKPGSRVLPGVQGCPCKQGLLERTQKRGWGGIARSPPQMAAQDRSLSAAPQQLLQDLVSGPERSRGNTCSLSREGGEAAPLMAGGTPSPKPLQARKSPACPGRGRENSCACNTLNMCWDCAHVQA